MSHELDITNGQASFVDSRDDAWHALGQRLGRCFTAEEAMKEGLLGDWNVRKVPMWATLPEIGGVSQQVEVSDRLAVVRDNPVVAGQVDYLGIVSQSYKILQNEDLALLLNMLVDESGAHFETAGALKGGRIVFLTMKLPGHILVGGVDQVDLYLAIISSHDGTKPICLMVTPVRIVCKNTLNMAFGSRTGLYTVRHTSGAESAIRALAREKLDLSFAYLDGFQEEAERLINTACTQAQFEEIIERNFGAPLDAPKATQTRTRARLADIAELFSDAETQAGVRGTAWAGLNALTEWYDHASPVRGDTSRDFKAVFEPEFKNRALAVMSALC